MHVLVLILSHFCTGHWFIFIESIFTCSWCSWCSLNVPFIYIFFQSVLSSEVYVHHNGIALISHQNQPLKNYGKCFLFHLKFFFASFKYSNVWNFPPSCPNFSGCKRKIEIRIKMTLLNGSHKLPIVIFGKNPKPLWIKASKMVSWWITK